MVHELTPHAAGARRVAFIVDSLGLSGKTKAVVDLAVHLDRARFEPAVVSLQPSDSVLVERLRASDVEFHPLHCPEGLSPRAFRCLGDCLRKLAPDVLHCWNPRAMLLGGAVAKRLGIRSVVASLSAFACLVPDRRYPFLPQKLYTVGARSMWRNRIAAGLANVVVAPTEALGLRFAEFNRIPARKIRGIGYGVDVAAPAAVSAEQIASARATLGAASGQVLVGSVGRLVEQKDYPTQLEAFSVARRDVPSLRMALVGDGPLRADLEGLCRSLEITQAVVFAGEHSNVWPVLRALDVFALTSKFEPYGVGLLEAKAAGTAIVATGVDQIPSLLGNGSSGMVVPAADVRAVAGAFCQLATDGERRAALGRAAREEAVGRHDISVAVSSYQRLYAEALGAT